MLSPRINEHTNNILKFVFHIFLSVEKIYFTKELEDTKVKDIGKPATLECEISKDGLKVEWFFGSKKLRRGEDYDISVSGKTHTLVIEKVTVDLVGEYKAEYKTASTSCKLSLAGMLNSIHVQIPHDKNLEIISSESCYEDLYTKI